MVKTSKLGIRYLFRVVSLLTGLLWIATQRARQPGCVVRIVVMDPRYFGHQCLEPEVFLHDKRKSWEQGENVRWFCCLGRRSQASNEHLWKLQRRRLPALPSWFVTDLAYWKQRLTLTPVEIKTASIFRVNCLSDHRTTLAIPDQVSARRREILSNFGSPSLPYVVFTIRDRRILHDPDDLRNRSVIEFEPAITSLTERGFNVIRLTATTTDPLSSTNERILDWQVRRDGRPGDEIAIMSDAAFVVSTTTGGDSLGLICQRPVLYVDSARLLLVFLGTEFATFHMPRIEDAVTGNRLTFREVLDRGLARVRETHEFAERGVRVINSSPQEIKQCVDEFADLFLGSTNSVAETHQSQWRETLLLHGGSELAHRHGEIRARMHPASLRDLEEVSS